MAADPNRSQLPVDADRLARRLEGYANCFMNPCAEACIAKSFAAQIRAGETQIDLSQAYASGDPVKAAVRHVKAIHNIDVLVQEAMKLGYSIHSGQAFAVGEQIHRIDLYRDIDQHIPSTDACRVGL